MNLDIEPLISIKFKKLDVEENSKFYFSAQLNEEEKVYSSTYSRDLWKSGIGNEKINILITRDPNRFTLLISVHRVSFLGLKTERLGNVMITIERTFAKDFWHERNLSIFHENEGKSAHFRIEFRLSNFGEPVIRKQYPLHDIFSPEYEGLGHILQNIFSYLSPNELFKSMPLLSKHCLSTVRNIPMNEQLRVHTVLTTSQFFQFLSTFPNIFNIFLDGFVCENLFGEDLDEIGMEGDPDGLMERVRRGRPRPRYKIKKLEVKSMFRKFPGSVLSRCCDLEELIIHKIHAGLSPAGGWLGNCSIDSTSDSEDLLAFGSQKQHNSLKVFKILSTNGEFDMLSLDKIFTNFLKRCLNLQMISCPENYDFTDRHRLLMRNNNFTSVLETNSFEKNPMQSSGEENDEIEEEEDRIGEAESSLGSSPDSIAVLTSEDLNLRSRFYELSIGKEEGCCECFMDRMGLIWLIRYEDGEDEPMNEDYVIVEPLFHPDDRTCFVTKIIIVADFVLTQLEPSPNGSGNGSEDDGPESKEQVRRIVREFVSGFSSTSGSFKVLRFSKNRSCRNFNIQFQVLNIYDNYEAYHRKELQSRTSLLALPHPYPLRVSHEFDLSGLSQFETLYNGDRVFTKSIWVHCFRYRISITYVPRIRFFTVYIVSLHARDYVVTSSIRLVFNEIKREIDHAVFDGRGGYGWNDLSVDEKKREPLDKTSFHMYLFFTVHRIFDRDEYRIYTKEKQQRWSKIETLFYHKIRQKEIEKELGISENNNNTNKNEEFEEEEEVELISSSSSSSSSPATPRQYSNTSIEPKSIIKRSESSDSVDSLISQQEKRPIQKCKKTIQLISPQQQHHVSTSNEQSQRVMFELHGIRWVLSFHPNRGKFGRSAFFIRCEDLVGSYVLRIRWYLRGDIFQQSPLQSALQDYFEGRVWGFDEIQLLDDNKSMFEVEVEIDIVDVFAEGRYFRWQRWAQEQAVLNEMRESAVVEIPVGLNPVQTESFVVCGVPFMMECYLDGIDSLEHISVILYHRLEIHFVVTANYRIFCINDDGETFSSRRVKETDEHATKFSNVCKKDLTKEKWRIKMQVKILSVQCHSHQLPKLQDSHQVYSK